MYTVRRSYQGYRDFIFISYSESGSVTLRLKSLQAKSSSERHLAKCLPPLESQIVNTSQEYSESDRVSVLIVDHYRAVAERGDCYCTVECQRLGMLESVMLTPEREINHTVEILTVHS